MQIEDANLDKIHCKLYFDGISNFIFENVSKTHSNLYILLEYSFHRLMDKSSRRKNKN